MNRSIALFFAAALTASATAHAPHGWMSYDASQTFALIGKGVESGHEHPHGFPTLQTADQTWTVCWHRRRAWSAAARA